MASASVKFCALIKGPSWSDPSQLNLVRNIFSNILLDSSLIISPHLGNLHVMI
jgi:hypothetical protein